jgi:dihydrolipoamide dehydrogenase
MDYDLIVIGSGPGGYVAAIRAAQAGLKVAIAERENLGGICLNWGCIPTKALLKTAEVFDKLKHLDEYGLSAEKPGFDLAKVVDRSRKVAAQLNGGVAFLMKKHKITVIEGDAKLLKNAPAPKVVVTDKAKKETTYTAQNIILAVGARARSIESIGLVPDGKLIWNYRHALVPATMMKRLLVIGSGAIGIEFASFYRALGAEVTVIEAMDRILPVEDHEVSDEAMKAFKKRGIKFHTGAKVTKVETSATEVTVHIEELGKQTKLIGDVLISAVGIVANTDSIGADILGLEMDRGHVKTNSYGKTNIAGLYAIGDCAGPPWLAHKASHEGIHVVDHIVNRPLSELHSPIPGCTYSTPQVASVGLTEQGAKESGREVKIGRFPFKVNGKAIASGETTGFVKTLFDAKTGALVGAHLIGDQVTEMIQGFTVAITMEATEEDLHNTVFPHPTMSEAMHESSLDAFGQVIHI